MTEPLIDTEHPMDDDEEEISVADILYDVLTYMEPRRVLYRDNDFHVLVRSYETH